MYQYTEFDKQFVHSRASQFRDQLERWQAGTLAEDEFRPLRLQNGWYVQRFAPMLRIAVPYGELNSAQLRVLATIARDYDHKEENDLSKANPGLSDLKSLPSRCAHFTTRQNVQFNWIPLVKSADVMDLLASVNMHGIQTSGNCIRNTTSDERAGVAVDEVADPRPLAEIIRQWSTLHPEFAFLPRKFKIAITGATDDRAATAWHDVGLHVIENPNNDSGEIGFRVMVGGGMGRTPMVGTVIREFLAWDQILNYLEAVVRVYNRWGRRDNIYKARIKILVKAEGQRYIDEVEAEYKQILDHDGAPHTISQQELDRVTASFKVPASRVGALPLPAMAIPVIDAGDENYTRWLARNVAPHKNPALRCVTLSFKRLGYSPGDATGPQLDLAADLADRYSAGEARVTHDQNLVLPWVRADELPALYAEAHAAGLAKANVRLLTDMIVCPGGDFCALANARSLPISEAISQRYQDLDELHDIGEIDVHMSGCINSCGHHHSAHIGILGVDKDGQEWYQVTLGGSDGSDLSGAAGAGKVVGPSFAAAEVPDVFDAVLDTYRSLRQSAGEKLGGKAETFIDTLRRVGHDPFKQAANAARTSTGRTAPQAATA